MTAAGALALEAEPPFGDIAMFWDIENADPEDFPATVSAVMKWVGSSGRIVINDAFGDFTRRFARYREVLAKARVHPQHVEPRRKHLDSPAERKNLADIVLTIAVAECVLTKRNVGQVVIVSGDSDFIELAEWCRAQGKYVTGIAAGRVTRSGRGHVIGSCTAGT